MKKVQNQTIEEYSDEIKKIRQKVIDDSNKIQLPENKEEPVKEAKRNPKKLQRDIKKSLGKTGISTKSQQALKLQQEQNKQNRKAKSREEKQVEAARQFELKQQKKKEKHRGK